MKIRKSFIIIVMIFLIVIVSAFATFKNSKDADISVIQEENEVNKKQLSMYIENDEGNYEEYTTSNFFPDSSLYLLNLEKSKCVDNNGNLIDGILSSKENKITVTSNKTAYCYIYFDIDNSAATYLINNISSEEFGKVL